MYNHGFATLALAEYYGLTNDTSIGPALKKATNLIVSAQKTNPKGAWRYSPESKDADTTVTGAQMVALFAAKMQVLKFQTRRFPKVKSFFSNAKTKEVDSDIQVIQGPIFLELPLVPSFLPSIRIQIQMHLKIHLIPKRKCSLWRPGPQVLQSLLYRTGNVSKHSLKTGTNGI